MYNYYQMVPCGCVLVLLLLVTGANTESKPTNLQVSLTLPDCVTLTWDHPNSDNVDGYQYRCRSPLWKPSGKSRTATECGITQFAGVSCRVRVEDAVETEISSADLCSGCLPCPVLDLEPPQPSNLSFGSHTKVKNSERWRYQYNVTWAVPSAYISCLHPVSPYQWKADSYNEVGHDKNTWIMRRESNVEININVWVRNKGGTISTPATKSIRVPLGLPPQVAPRNFQLTAVSPHCVYLSWDPVEYPNGPESGIVYQHNCNAIGWINIPDTHVVCGFTPNSLVSCKIRARRGSNSNDNRNSEVSAAKNVTTCNGLSDELSLEVNDPVQRSHLGRERWKYNISWKITNYACGALPPEYRIEVNGELKLRNTALTLYSFYSDGDVELTISLWLVYKNEELSTLTTKSIITPPGLPPQVAPTNLQLTVVSPYCVSLSWDPVQYPNGPESNIIYQYTCDYADTETRSYTNVSVMEVQPHTVCGFRSAEKIECRVKAVNIAGESPVAMIAGYASLSAESLHCSSPPVVANAGLLKADSSWAIGETAGYSCYGGYYQRGESGLTCDLVDGSAEWNGNPPTCKPIIDIAIGLGAGLSGGFVLVIAVIVISVAIIIRRKTNRAKAPEAKSAEGKSTPAQDEYEDMTTTTVQQVEPKANISSSSKLGDVTTPALSYMNLRNTDREKEERYDMVTVGHFQDSAYENVRI